MEAAGVHSKVMPVTCHARPADNWPNRFDMVTYRDETADDSNVTEGQSAWAQWLKRVRTGLFSRGTVLEVEGDRALGKLRYSFNNATDSRELADAVVDQTNAVDSEFKKEQSREQALQQSVEAYFPGR